MSQAARCPHCHEQLVVVAEVFREWYIFPQAGGGWVLGAAEPFEFGTCNACGEFVDASGQEGPPPEAADA